MMNRLMTVKLSVSKREKTENRQAVSIGQQISVLNRQKQFGPLSCFLAEKPVGLLAS